MTVEATTTETVVEETTEEEVAVETEEITPARTIISNNLDPIKAESDIVIPDALDLIDNITPAAVAPIEVTTEETVAEVVEEIVDVTVAEAVAEAINETIEAVVAEVINTEATVEAPAQTSVEVPAVEAASAVVEPVKVAEAETAVEITTVDDTTVVEAITETAEITAAVAPVQVADAVEETVIAAQTEETPVRTIVSHNLAPITMESGISIPDASEMRDNTEPEVIINADLDDGADYMTVNPILDLYETPVNNTRDTEELKPLTASEILTDDQIRAEKKLAEEIAREIRTERIVSALDRDYVAYEPEFIEPEDVAEETVEEEKPTLADRVFTYKANGSGSKLVAKERSRKKARKSADEAILASTDDDFDVVGAARLARAQYAENAAANKRDIFDDVIMDYTPDEDIRDRRTAPIDNVELLTPEEIGADDRILRGMDADEALEEREALEREMRVINASNEFDDDFDSYSTDEDLTLRYIDEAKREVLAEVESMTEYDEDETDEDEFDEDDLLELDYDGEDIIIPDATRMTTEGLRAATLASTTPFNSHRNKDLTRDALWLMALKGTSHLDESVTNFIDMNATAEETDNDMAILIPDVEQKTREYDIDSATAGRFVPGENDEAPGHRKVTIADLLRPTAPANEAAIAATPDMFTPVGEQVDDDSNLPDITALAREFAFASMKPSTFSDGGVSVNDESGKLGRFDMSHKPVNIGDTLTVDGQDMKVLAAYDISFADAAGSTPEYSDDDAFEVALPAPAGADASEITAVYYDESGEGKHEKLPTSVARGASGNPEIRFTTSHFSVFALVTASPEYFEQSYPTDEAADEAQPTGDSVQTDVTDATDVADTADEASNDATVMVNGELVLVHYRSSYMSRLIQSDEQLKDYYSVIKNALLSFSGVKSRISWSGESFNKGRINCAKVNVKGRSLTVALALNPEDYEGTKYYFKDVSDKPKYDKVPMLIKVRSDRSLKYALELIEEMMDKLDIEFESESLVDYTMPYESTESLVARELIKVILPSGMTLDDNANIVKMDVAKLIEEAKDAEDDSADFDGDTAE